MTEKRYKIIDTNVACSNGMEYMLIRKHDGFDVAQVCSKYTAKEIVDELNSLAEENRLLREQLREMFDLFNNSGLDYHISDELEEILND